MLGIMSDDLVTEARRLAADKVQLIEGLKAAQDTVSEIDRVRRDLQKVAVPEQLREQYDRALAALDGLHTAGKEYTSERRKDARSSWSLSDLQRLGLARPARKSPPRSRQAADHVRPAEEEASADEAPST